jgi:hypothetical protein
MGQRDQTVRMEYVQALEALLDQPMALTLPEDVLRYAARRTFARGFEPREAAVLICHEHSRRLSRQLIEQSEMASDLVELVIANRIDGCAELASQMDHDVMDLLPDLPYFVRQACFSPEFRGMVAEIATWHGIPEHRWSVPEVDDYVSDRVTA